jgi:hypothetical protein
MAGGRLPLPLRLKGAFAALTTEAFDRCWINKPEI